MSSVAGQSRWERMNRPPRDERWVWFTRSMMEAPAWRALSGNARLVVDRVIVEHMHHGLAENGDLPVTYDDFEVYGIRRRSISQAIKQAVALGFIDVIDKGRKSYGSARRPARYGLTWLPRSDRTPASNRWKSINTNEQVEAILSRLKQRRETASPPMPDHGDADTKPTPGGDIYSSGDNAPGEEWLKAAKS